MIQGLYAAASGMVGLERRQDVIANNIANAATPGFRRHVAVNKGFNEILLHRMRHPFRLNAEPSPGGGQKLVETFTDVQGGNIVATEDPLNIALQGPGYIGIETPQGERFTRNGKLAIDANGLLTTPDGYHVQSVNGGAIDVTGGDITIDEDGNVHSQGLFVAQIRLVEFEDPHMLTRVGANLYEASDEAMRKSAQAVDTRVLHKSLELSNVQVPAEMVQMILGARVYTANERVINAINESVGRLINDVAMPV
ncbi:MAG: flagellar hook-basal body protein [Candidatus Hydrogenedentota bacterium]